MFNRKMFRTGLLGYCALFITAANTQTKTATSSGIKDPVYSDTSFLSASYASNEKLNTKALQFVKAYLKKNSYDLDKLQNRKKNTLHTIESVFTKNDIPVELKCLAIIESGLNSSLVENSGAAGIWQIMPQTGKELGLVITEKYDERFLVYKSTKAITKYLKQLYDRFGDCLLVVAAYNSGPGTVIKAIQMSGSKNFWKLQNYLPLETRNHVKKYISVRYYYQEKNLKALLTKA